MITVAIPGNISPMKNQSQGLLPIRLAKRAVIIGTPNMASKPIEKTIISPMLYCFFVIFILPVWVILLQKKLKFYSLLNK
jgi:hypothetical protein